MRRPARATWNPTTIRGLEVYLLLTFVGTWVPAWWLRDTWLGEGRPLGTRLLTCSLFYAVTMGWQPLAAAWAVRKWVDPRTDGDEGLRSPGRKFMLIGGAAPFALAMLAALVALLAGGPGASAPGAWQGMAEPELAMTEPSLRHALSLGAAGVVTLTLLWAQSLGEEIGWRGYFLTRLMRACGPWTGLLLHGLVWGLWYAPVFLLANGDLGESALRGAGFVLTCSLLGALLGWLRLASGSVLPTTIANALLTVAAGLPFLLQGVDIGLRGSAYGPPGWVPMAAALAVLALGPWRRDILMVRTR